MLSPPEELDPQVIVAALAAGWALTPASLTYRPVGFGSHHWEFVDAGERWFATVDDLATKGQHRGEPLDAAFTRLRASLNAALDLRSRGHAFVVAPVPAADGELATRLDERFALAVYPYIDGQSFSHGPFPSAEHRDGLLDLLVRLHRTPATAAALRDDFTVPYRDELEAALAGDPVEDCGPYAQQTATLMRVHADAVRGLLARYDALAADGRTQADRMVLTHGEPHPGNTMLGADGWLLIDWDTALVSLPERDLWALAAADSTLVTSYVDRTGVKVLEPMLELFQVRWDVADLAVDVAQFRRPHTGNPNDAATFDVLTRLTQSILES